jgi:hypothetical protein
LRYSRKYVLSLMSLSSEARQAAIPKYAVSAKPVTIKTTKTLWLTFAPELHYGS